MLLVWVPVVGPWLATRTLLTGPEPELRRRGEGFAFFRLFKCAAAAAAAASASAAFAVSRTPALASPALAL